MACWNRISSLCLRLALLLPGLTAFPLPGSAQAVRPPADYADPGRWMCLPGRMDTCSRALDVRTLAADGSSRPSPAIPVAAGPIDCFYVYPTVDFSLIPGNPDRRDGDRSAIERMVEAQLIPFRGSCRVFAPLYRQATIGAYALPEDIRQQFIQVGAADVIAAFDRYLATWNQGRRIVFIGHSQGSEALIKLMQARIDQAPALHGQMALALLTGIPSFVPVGHTTGGTFANIPVCTRALEQGCFVSFASFEDGSTPTEDGRIPTPSGQERVCVNPAALDDRTLSVDARRTARRTLRQTYLPPWSYMSGSIRNDARTQTFTRIDQAFSGACTSTAQGYRFFSIREELSATDRRYGMVKLDSNISLIERLLDPFGPIVAKLLNIGLHVIDMQLPMEDMVALVEARRGPA